ncbi:MAG TPA: hypothetical protein VFJ85_11460 [Acidimicrobiales bacterium]|nr:hypothetical protein [Acidimicrobiales bacterium]
MDPLAAPPVPAACRECGVAIRPGALTCREHSAATLAASGTVPPPGRTRPPADVPAGPAWAPQPPPASPPMEPARFAPAGPAQPGWPQPAYGTIRPAPLPAKRSTWRIVLIVAAVVVGAFVGLAVLGAFVNGMSGVAGKVSIDEYNRGGAGKPFVAADDGFRATFPSEPIHTTQKQIVPTGAMELSNYFTASEEESFAVSSGGIPPGAGFDPNVGLDGAAGAIKGTVQSRVPTTFAGYPAVQGLIVSADGKAFVEVLIVRAPNRFYILSVTAGHNPPPGFDRFKASFELLP